MNEKWLFKQNRFYFTFLFLLVALFYVYAFESEYLLWEYPIVNYFGSFFLILTSLVSWFYSKKEDYKALGLFFIFIFNLLFFVSLKFQSIYQISLSFALWSYFLHNIGFLFPNVWTMFLELSLWEYYLLVFPILFFTILHRVPTYARLFFLLLGVLSILDTKFVINRTKTTYLTSIKSLDTKNDNRGYPRSKSNWEKNCNFFQSNTNPHIIFFLLEGVSRKESMNQFSKYFPFELLRDSHFWIPIPHSSKSIVSFLSSQPQYESSRVVWNEAISKNNLAKELKTLGYQTTFLYTQDIHLEGLDEYLVRSFDRVFDRSSFLNIAGNRYKSFSWGMEDRVLTEWIQKEAKSFQSPQFIVIGLSQTHHPYFAVNSTENDLYKRYSLAKQETIAAVDSAIESWLEKIKEPTLFILSADHGESFGEKKEWGHNYSVYNQQTDVPFMVFFSTNRRYWFPKFGSALDFRPWLLGFVKKSFDPTLLGGNSYSTLLFQSSWNSPRQRGMVTSQKKYIYESTKDTLWEMDWNEENIKQISDGKQKAYLLKKMYESKLDSDGP